MSFNVILGEGESKDKENADKAGCECDSEQL